jgi:alpha-1,3-rhamnosyl/mannosyltransferase
MRVLVDATPILVESAGIKSYIHCWVKALRAYISGRDHLSLYPFLWKVPALDHELSPNTSYGAWARISLTSVVNNLRKPALDFLCRSVDVFHVSHHLTNLPNRTKLTATVHDMTCWTMPEVHTPANVCATRRYGNETLRRADALIAVSENSRRDCADVLGIPASRMEVIYPGIPDSYFDVAEADGRRVMWRYGLQRPYVLFVGCIEPRKNLGTLIRAWQDLYFMHKGNLELVVAGPRGWERPEVLSALDQTPGIRRLGYVPEPNLPGLFKGAELLVYPSLYEGFGLPVAQAMAVSTPIVTTNGSSLSEITGGGACLVDDPRDPDSLAATMQALLHSPDLRQILRVKARLQAERYRWARAARQSIDFFHRVAA